MKKRYKVGAIALLVMQLNGLHAVACNNTWTGGTSMWDLAANWGGGCVPSASGDTAHFASMGSTTVALTQLGPLGFVPTLTALDFDVGAQSYTFTGIANSGFAFDPAAAINVNAGTQTFNSSVNQFSFGGNATITVNNGAILNINCESVQTASSIITFVGAGAVNLDTPHFQVTEVDFTGPTVVSTGLVDPTTNIEITTCAVTNDGGAMGNNLTNGITILDAGFSNINSATFGNGANGILAENCGIINDDSQFGVGVVGINIQNAGVNNQNHATFASTTTEMLIENAGINDTNQSTFSFLNLLAINTGVNVDKSSFGNGSNDTNFENSTLNLTNNAIAFQNTTGQFTLTSGSLAEVDATSVLGPVNLGFLTGTLLNNGTVYVGYNVVNPTIVLNAPDVIAGTGVFRGTNYTIQNGGTVIPGSSLTVGTLTLDPGHYVETSTGTLQINVGHDVASLLVADTAELDGRLLLQGLGTVGDDTRGVFPIIITNNGVTGTFSKIESINFPSGYTFDVIYDPNEVLLGIESPFTSTLSNYNYLIFSSVNQVNFYVFKHLNWVKERFFCNTCCPCVDNVVNVYAAPIGSVGHVNNKRASIGFNYDTVGVLGGIEYIMAQTAFGVEVDYQRMHGHNRKEFGLIDNDLLHFNAYATYSPIYPLSFSLLVGGGENWLELDRNTLVERARGKTSATTFDVLFGADYTFCVNNFNFTPLAAVQYIKLNVNQYRETGAGLFNNAYDRMSFDSVRSLLGFNADYCMNLCGFGIVPSVNFVWQREYRDHRQFIIFNNLFTTEFQSLEIPTGERNVYLGGADVNFILADRYGIDLGYEFEGNQRFTNHFFTLTLNAEF